MPDESKKSGWRYHKYLLGDGIDIGCGNDPVLPGVRKFDIIHGDGDAQKMDSIGDESFDFVYSSHTLEHVHNPLEALLNWWRILKFNGHLVVMIPEEDLYEQSIWPPAWNDDHKRTFAIHRDKSWSPQTTNVLDLVRHLPDHKLLLIETLDANYDYSVPVGDYKDQTHQEWNAEAGIGFVLKKVAQVPRKTTLRDVLQCPDCRGELIVAGKTKDLDWAVRCTQCKFVGKAKGI